MFKCQSQVLGSTDIFLKFKSQSRINSSQVSEITGPRGHTVSFAYDALVRQTNRVNQAGNTSAIAYDELDRVKTVTDEENAVTEYFYDDAENIISEYTQGEGASGTQKTAYYAYDGRNQLTQTNEQGQPLKQYKYDNVGNITTEYESGKKIDYRYSVVNQLVEKIMPEAHYVYDYDDRGNIISETNNGIVEKSYI